MLTAQENLVLPLTIAGRKSDDGWLDTLVPPSTWAIGSATGPPSCRVASSSASPSPARWSASRS